MKVRTPVLTEEEWLRQQENAAPNKVASHHLLDVASTHPQ